MPAKKLTIKPLFDRVLIEPLSEEERLIKTKSGIVLPDSVDKEKIDRGVVLEVGPGKMTDSGKKIPMTVKKGQIVVFPEFSADKIKVDDKDYYVVAEGNIMAVID
jgi:chaperonin GroES